MRCLAAKLWGSEGGRARQAEPSSPQCGFPHTPHAFGSTGDTPHHHPVRSSLGLPSSGQPGARQPDLWLDSATASHCKSPCVLASACNCEQHRAPGPSLSSREGGKGVTHRSYDSQSHLPLAEAARAHVPGVRCYRCSLSP